LVPFAYVTFAAFFPRQYTKAINAWLQLTGHKTRMAEEDSLRISTRLMLGVVSVILLFLIVMQVLAVLWRTPE
jgi:flagellar biosynthesis protein FlhB